MKKAAIIILIITIVLLYLVREGKKAALKSEDPNDKNLGLMDCFFKGVENLSPRHTASFLHLSNFAFRTIVK